MASGTSLKSKRQSSAHPIAEGVTFRLLIEAVTDYAIYLLDARGHISSWNSGAERIKGYTADEVMGRHFSMFFPPEDRLNGKPARALETAAATGRFEDEGWRVRKDGTRFWATAVLDAVYDTSGALVGFAKITRDITEKREAQKALQQAQEQLFQAQKMEALGQLTGGVAHDFNNLLAAIMSGVSLLERIAAGGDRARQVLSAMRQAAKRGEALTQQLLSFARRQTLQPEIVDLQQRIGETFNLLERLLSGSIRVSIEVPAGLWPLKVDPSQLELALLNVCLNSRDAMAEGGTLTISARNATHPVVGLDPARRYVEVSVTDTGIGMAPEVKSRIFEPFFTTKDVGKGSGLGLSQAYGFAQQSGGAISVDSELGCGTTITFVLPAAEPGETAASASLGRDEAVKPGASGTILLVEDDHAVAELTSALLEHAGYKVVRAHNGAVALNILSQAAGIDVVFSDVVMPGGMDGLELARTIRALYPAIPVLLTTGFGHRISEIKETGIQLMRKPYDPLEVMARIDELIAAATGSSRSEGSAGAGPTTPGT
jgi:PAS domain S-box-containing protein